VKPARRYTVVALARGLDILETLADNRAATLGEVTLRTRMPKTTAFRLLATLQARGFVERTPTGTYQPGLRLIQLAQVTHAAADLRRVAQPYLGRLHDISQDTVNLVIWHDRTALYLEVLASPRPLRFAEAPGSAAPLHATALGKAIAAHLPEEDVIAILKETGLPRFTPRTITTIARLLREFRRIRERGCAIDRQEQDIGAVCVAAPIFDAHGVVGAVSIAAPAARMKDRRLAGLVPELLDACAGISHTLGARSLPGVDVRFRARAAVAAADRRR
jgi:IclR family acetate operon transcriptional repressor